MRAQDLIDGKIGVIEAAQRLCVLSTWIHARKDKDFSVFLKIGFELLPCLLEQNANIGPSKL